MSTDQSRPSICSTAYSIRQSAHSSLDISSLIKRKAEVFAIGGTTSERTAPDNSLELHLQTPLLADMVVRAVLLDVEATSAVKLPLLRKSDSTANYF